MRIAPGAIAAWWRRWFGPKPLGVRGEEAAARFLRRLGYRIVVRNGRSKLGEIDLVATDGGTVVFVEVKTRVSDASGPPEQFVHVAKQRRLTQLALAFLKSRRLLDRPARFDVVAVTWPADGRSPRIEHFPGAFEAAGSGGFFS